MDTIVKTHNRRAYTKLRSSPVALDPRVPLDESQYSLLPEKLKEQITAAGLNTPELLLFPTHDDLLAQRDKYLFVDSPGYHRASRFNPKDRGAIIGFAEPIKLNLSTQKDQKECTSNQLTDHPLETRIFGALHETAHFIGDVKKIDSSLLTDITQRKGFELPDGISPEVFAATLKERLADTTAALYIMSNFKTEDGFDTVKASRLFRQSFPEPTHFTNSSIEAAQAAFKQKPTYGLTIIDATKMAADIISKQPNLVQELLDANKDFQTLQYADIHHGVPPPLSIERGKHDSGERWKKIEEARKKFCNPPAAGK